MKQNFKYIKSYHNQVMKIMIIAVYEIAFRKINIFYTFQLANDTFEEVFLQVQIKLHLVRITLR